MNKNLQVIPGIQTSSPNVPHVVHKTNYEREIVSLNEDTQLQYVFSSVGQISRPNNLKRLTG